MTQPYVNPQFVYKEGMETEIAKKIVTKLFKHSSKSSELMKKIDTAITDTIYDFAISSIVNKKDANEFFKAIWYLTPNNRTKAWNKLKIEITDELYQIVINKLSKLANNKKG